MKEGQKYLMMASKGGFTYSSALKMEAERSTET
jgi:hypothetical protein